MNQLSLYVISNDAPIDAEREEVVKAAYKSALERCINRFHERDSVGHFSSITQYICVFDQAVLDSMMAVDNITEVEARQVVQKNELVIAPFAKEIWAKVAIEIEHHLNPDA